VVVLRGMQEPRPSAASAKTPWTDRFRVRTVRPSEEARLAA
jgi:hypothetical protein